MRLHWKAIQTMLSPAPSPRLPENGCHVTDFKDLPGAGVSGTVGGRQVLIVSPSFAEAKGIAVNDLRLDELTDQAKTVVLVIIDGTPAGAVALADIVRP